jgi:hypothetical protein
MFRGSLWVLAVVVDVYTRFPSISIPYLDDEVSLGYIYC